MISVLWLISGLFIGCETDKDPANPVFFDGDGDGYKSDVDCDDENPAVYPGAPEICDAVDNNCDQLIDSADPLVVADSGYTDADGDGYGAGEAIVGCDLAENTVAVAGDCDDTDANVSPADSDGDGFSTCDGDCDDTDTNVSPADLDADGVSSCDGDCDDNNAAIFPDAVEVCDGVDNDCDNSIDTADDSLDSSTAPQWYQDSDGDGEGDAANSTTDCSAPQGYVDNANDCDDENAALQNLDVDADGVSSCDGDCDDTDSTIQSCDYCIDDNLYSAVGFDLLTASLDTISGLEHSCGDGPGQVIRWVAPANGDYRFSVMADFDPFIAMWTGCDETEQACEQSYELSRQLSEGEEVLLVVGGVEVAATGSFSLSIGSSAEVDCADGIDEDADGLTDCDDEDDCWYDEQCAFADCPNFDLIDLQTFEPALGDDLLQGTLSLATNDYAASCMDEATSGPDYAFYWEAPADGCARIRAYSDTVDVAIATYAGCNEEELQCTAEDVTAPTAAALFGTVYGASVEQTVQAGEDYLIVVDSVDSAFGGTYSMSIELVTLVYCDGTLVE